MSPKNNLPKPKELIKKEIFAVYKPKGWTSFKIVKILRDFLKVKKIGYSGTLDPMAEGVLVVGVQKGTKRLRFLPPEKEYVAEVAFGAQSQTWDMESKKIKIKKSIPQLSPNLIKKKIKEFEGEITQIVPAFSAKKIGGKRLYRLARSGKEFSLKDLPRKKVFIKEIKLLDFKPKAVAIKNKKITLPVAKLKIKCSKGTFIRSLAFELGQKINLPAVLIKLIRTKDGGFSIKKALSVKNLES